MELDRRIEIMSCSNMHASNAQTQLLIHSIRMEFNITHLETANYIADSHQKMYTSKHICFPFNSIECQCLHSMPENCET